MQQFNIHVDAYDAIRGMISYPESLYLCLDQLCEEHNAALDIGCGNGVSSIRLKKYFPYVEGTDLGENLIAKAKANYPEIHFVVAPAETHTPQRKFDLITSATSFYWMDRDRVLQRVANFLSPRGVFCAYKYDFPIVYGPLRDLIEKELVTRWATYRNPRLTMYDDTLEKIEKSNRFESAERKIFSNIIGLSPLEIGLFFLSTSYVTKYIDQEGGAFYREDFLGRIAATDSSSAVKANFDIHAFLALAK